MDLTDIDLIITRLTKACDAKNQTEMLEKMGLSNSAASTWKKRRAVPDSSIAMVAAKTGASFQWLKTGEGEMFESSSGQGGPIDPIILQATIESTEKILLARQTTLTPAQKAQFICTLYEMAMEQGESVLDETNMKRLLRLVG